MALSRWEPFRELSSMRSLMDRLFEEGYWEPRSFQGESMLPLDVVDHGDEYQIMATLPGVSPDDVDITVSGNTLSIRGQFKEEREEKDYLLHERRYGSFARSVTLPVGLDAEKAEARFENGILTLTLPKAAEAKPKRIQVRQSGALPEGSKDRKAA